jgi:hypothetical protein
MHVRKASDNQVTTPRNTIQRDPLRRDERPWHGGGRGSSWQNTKLSSTSPSRLTVVTGSGPAVARPWARTTSLGTQRRWALWPSARSGMALTVNGSYGAG